MILFNGGTSMGGTTTKYFFFLTLNISHTYDTISKLRFKFTNPILIVTTLSNIMWVCFMWPSQNKHFFNREIFNRDSIYLLAPSIAYLLNYFIILWSEKPTPSRKSLDISHFRNIKDLGIVWDLVPICFDVLRMSVLHLTSCPWCKQTK